VNSEGAKMRRKMDASTATGPRCSGGHAACYFVEAANKYARLMLLAAILLASADEAVAAQSETNARVMPDAAASSVPDAHLQYAPGKAPKFWSVATAETIMARWPDYTKAYFNSWTYVNGYAFCAFERLGRDTGDSRYIDYIKRYVDQFIDEQGNFHSVTNNKGQLRSLSFNNLDNMMTGNSVVMLYERTRDERYRKAADKIRRALDDYPRNGDGGFWHARSLPGQMWIDGIFMGQMFLTRYGQSIGDADYCWNEATKQMTVYAKRAERDHTGLFVHGVYEPSHGEKPCRWADPKTGLSPEVWSEGLGWYALVMAETLANLPKNHARRPEMEDIFRRLAAGLKRTQDPKSGRWFQVVDKGERPDNWTDTSGSAMFTYALARGSELGLLDQKEFAPIVAAGYKGITAFARINERGLVDIYQACDGVGVQTNYDRYIHYKQSVNAKEAVVGFLWATEIVEHPRLKSAK
jgi:unsaturated rhamnogalacturonyl hydrolase